MYHFWHLLSHTIVLSCNMTCLSPADFGPFALVSWIRIGTNANNVTLIFMHCMKKGLHDIFIVSSFRYHPIANCGLFFSFRGAEPSAEPEEMLSTLARFEPDDYSLWLSSSLSAGLAHLLVAGVAGFKELGNSEVLLLTPNVSISVELLVPSILAPHSRPSWGLGGWGGWVKKAKHKMCISCWDLAAGRHIRLIWGAACEIVFIWVTFISN